MIILTSAAVIVLFFFLDVTTPADPYVGCTRSDGYTEGIENADGECVNPATMKPFVSKPGLNFDCAIENKNMMATEAPGWAGKMEKNFAAYSEGWDPILEPVPGCNKISSSDVDPPLLWFEYLCVLDREWIHFYEDNKELFANQGYYTLLDSVNILFDRVSYLFEAQFGYKLSCKRVIAAPKLTHGCDKGMMNPEGGYTDVNSEGLTTNTWKALYDAGVPGKQVNEAGTIRFGSGMKPKKGSWNGYCHSNARGQVCGRNMIQMHRNPLEWQAAFTLAHELGHSFGMCAIKNGLPWSKYCIPSPGGPHTTYEVGDIMVLSGDPINDPDNGVGGMFNKFQTRCTEAPGVSASPGVSAYKPGELKVSVYDPMTCGYIESMNPTMRNAETVGQCASTLSCENNGLKNCGINYYTFKTTPTEAAVVRDRSSLHFVHCCSGCVSDGTLEVLSAGLSGTKLGPLNDKGCSKLMNYPAAQKFCKTAQHRLCTVDELKTIQTSSTTTFNDKCGYANKEVWTRTKESGENEDIECQKPVWTGGIAFDWPEVTAKPPQEKATKCIKGFQFFIKKSGRCTDGNGESEYAPVSSYLTTPEECDIGAYEVGWVGNEDCTGVTCTGPCIQWVQRSYLDHEICTGYEGKHICNNVENIETTNVENIETKQKIIRNECRRISNTLLPDALKVVEDRSACPQTRKPGGGWIRGCYYTSASQKQQALEIILEKDMRDYNCTVHEEQAPCPEKVKGVTSYSGGGSYKKTKEGDVIIIKSAVRIRNKYFFDDDGVRHESQGLDSVPRGCYNRAGLQFNTNTESNAPVAYPVLNSLCKRTCVAENNQMDGSDQSGDASGDTSNEDTSNEDTSNEDTSNEDTSNEDTSTDENEDGTSINNEKSGTKNDGIDAMGGTSSTNSGGVTNGANSTNNKNSHSFDNIGEIVVGVLCGFCFVVAIGMVVRYQKKKNNTPSKKTAVAIDIEMNNMIQKTNTTPVLPSRPNEIKVRHLLNQFNNITHKGDTHHKKKKGHQGVATKVVEIERNDNTSKQKTEVIEMSGKTMTLDSNPMRTTKRRSTLSPPLPSRRGGSGGSGSGGRERKGKKDTSLSSLKAV